MRIYKVNNKDVILLYRYIDEGIEVSTKYNDKLLHKHYRVDLAPYNQILDLIDDISNQFIEEEL